MVFSPDGWAPRKIEGLAYMLPRHRVHHFLGNFMEIQEKLSILGPDHFQGHMMPSFWTSRHLAPNRATRLDRGGVILHPTVPEGRPGKLSARRCEFTLHIPMWIDTHISTLGDFHSARGSWSVSSFVLLSHVDITGRRIEDNGYIYIRTWNHARFSCNFHGRIFV